MPDTTCDVIEKPTLLQIRRMLEAARLKSVIRIQKDGVTVCQVIALGNGTSDGYDSLDNFPPFRKQLSKPRKRATRQVAPTIRKPNHSQQTRFNRIERKNETTHSPTGATKLTGNVAGRKQLG